MEIDKKNIRRVKENENQYAFSLGLTYVYATNALVGNNLPLWLYSLLVISYYMIVIPFNRQSLHTLRILTKAEYREEERERESCQK